MPSAAPGPVLQRRRPERPPVRLSPAAVAPPQSIAPAVRRALTSSGAGRPLPLEIAGPLSSSLGVDVGPVRVHDGAYAATATAHYGVRAFTWGTHVFLGRGQRSTDLGLLAHEVSHAIQQGGGPAVQLFGGPHGDLEGEARRAAGAVVRGERVTVRGRTGPSVQREERPWYAGALGAVTDAGASALASALGFVKERAHSLPGYDLLGFVLGRDPVTQQPVERGAVNLVRGVLGLVPGGTALFDNLHQARVLQRAYEWLTAELDGLGLTWAYVRGLVQRAVAAVSVTDLLSPARLWEKLREVFGPPLRRLTEFAVAAGRKVAEFVFEGALALAGPAGQQVLAVFRRIGAAFGLVAADPVRFLGNLLSAVMGGFRAFGSNILHHLRTGIFEWLVGTLRGTVQLPTRWDFAGVLGLVLQILGLTYSALRSVLVEIIGERSVRYVEEAFDFLRSVVARGLAAAWDKIKEFAGNLAETVIQGIRDWVTRSVVGAALTKLVTLFNPVGAVIQAVITTYNTVMFFIERAQQIGRLLHSVLDSVESVARGNTAASADLVERTLATTLPVILGFLARMVGLGNVAEPVRRVIGNVRAAVLNAVRRVARWIADRARGLLGRVSGGPAATADSAQGRLRQGLAAAVAALARFGGTRVGAAVLRPLLGVVRLRYGMRDLDVVPRDDVWAVRGVVNPTDEQETPIRVSASGQPRPQVVPGQQVHCELPADKKNGRVVDVVEVNGDWFIKYRLPGGAGSGLVLARAYHPGKNPPRPAYRLASEEDPVFDTPVLTGGKALLVRGRPLRWKQGGGERPREHPVGWDRLRDGRKTADWSRTHLISGSMGGPGVAWNLVPTPSEVNNPGLYHGHEVKVLEAVRAGGLLWMRADVDYYADSEGGALGRASDFAKRIRVTFGETEGEGTNWKDKALTGKASYQVRLPRVEEIEPGRTAG
ncbi:DUF4157 domain-containing protein [Streptomyces roseus]|uniref:eCIS core domain-containing protein n=1 Tax=Streptomyces roseus TaxID=66430 RepID=UPI003684533A